MKGISNEAKVGLLVLIALFILGFLTFRAGNYELSQKDGYALKVIFRSVAGLDQKARVKVRGVDAGYVEAISLIPDGAELLLRIKEGIQIRENAVARIQSLGLMGEKYIEIEPGSEKFPLIQDGDWISIGLDTRDIDQLAEQIGTLADDLMAITHSLKTVIATQDGQQRIARIMENIENLTMGMNGLVAQNQKEINRLVKNLANFSQTLDELAFNNKDRVAGIVTDLNSFTSTLSEQGKRMMQDMESVTSNLKGLLDPNMENIGGTLSQLPAVTQKLDMTLGQLYRITEKMNKGEGTIGKLLTDDKLYNELSGALADIHTTLKKADAFSLHLGFKAEYLTEYDKSKSYFSLRFQPRHNKYYQLEFVNDFKDHVTSTRKVIDPNGFVTSTEEQSDEKLLISLLMAQKFGPFFLKGGLIESTGGVGIDYYPFENNDFFLGLEGWDFDLSKPHLKILAQLTLKRHFTLNMGWDNIMDSDAQSFFAGAGFTFQDNDLKYLITKLPLPGL